MKIRNPSGDIAQALIDSLKHDLEREIYHLDVLENRIRELQRDIPTVEAKVGYLKNKIEQFTDGRGQLRLPIEADLHLKYAKMPAYEAAKTVLIDQPSLDSKEAANMLIEAGVKFNGKNASRVVNIARTNLRNAATIRRALRITK